MDEQKKKDYLAQLESGIEKSKEERIKEVEANLDLHKKAREWALKEQELKNELSELIIENAKPLEPKHEYETVPRFWEINKELSRIKHQRELEGFNSQLAGLDKTIEMKEEELKRLKGE